ncbi:MAG TPA: dihydrofolate reductase family protein [Puia sp.]
MKISIYIAVSTNGLISNTRNVPDWLSPEYGQGFYTICQKTKAVIMGKTSYDILAPDYLPLKAGGKTIVLTTKKGLTSLNSTVVFTEESPAEIIKDLQNEGYTEAVIIGGAMAISTFLNSALVDEIYFVVEPVLFAGGLPLMQGVKIDRKLRLIDVTKLNDNTVQLHYQIC